MVNCIVMVLGGLVVARTVINLYNLTVVGIVSVLYSPMVVSMIMVCVA